MNLTESKDGGLENILNKLKQKSWALKYHPSRLRIRKTMFASNPETHKAPVNVKNI